MVLTFIKENTLMPFLKILFIGKQSIEQKNMPYRDYLVQFLYFQEVELLDTEIS